MPTTTETMLHVSTMEAPETLPKLTEALETLDKELDFHD